MNKFVPALFCAAALTALPATAAADENSWGADIEVMDEAELDNHRGGFEIAGIDVNFGAVVTTLVDGAPVLSTQLTWTDAGAIIEQTVGELGQDAASLSGDQLGALGLDPDRTAGGIVIVDDTGVTEIVHNVTEGALQNIVINSASGQDIAQQIDVSLELPGFELVQADLILERFGMRLIDDMHGIMFSDPGE
jgi:hypothetical protein